MKLTSITAKNLKGSSFTLSLSDINFLVGSNFKGKTTRTDAIRLLLVGYLPELGKLPRATFGLCSGRELVVEGIITGTGDTDLTIRRRWYLKGDTVKVEEEGFDQLISDESIGNVLAVMLNAEEYFALSDRDRVSYVFDNIPLPVEFSSDKLIERLEERLSKIEGIDEKAGKAFVDKIEQAESSLAREEGFCSAGPQSFLEAALMTAAAEGKASRAHSVKMESTVQGLAYLRTQDAPSVSVSQLDAARAEIAAEIADLEGKKAGIAAKASEARRVKARRELLASEVRSKSVFVDRKMKTSAALDAKEHEVSSIPLVEEADVEFTRNNEKALAMGYRDAQRDLADAESGLERIYGELNGIEAHTACPYCKATGQEWKAAKRAEINSAIAGLTTKRDQLKEHVATMRGASEEALERLNEKRDAVNSRRALTVEINSLRRDLETIEKNLAVIDAKEEELRGLPADDPALVAEVETIQTALNVTNDALRRHDADAKQALSRAGELKRLADAEKERDAAKIEETVAKHAGEILRQIQAELVDGAFKPLLETANAIFEHVLPFKLAYHEGEIGYWKSGVWVGHRTCSGTEKALAYAAIQAALAARSPVRLMIVDELGRLDAINSGLVVSCVAHAIKAGRMEQFVGIDVGGGADYRAMGEEAKSHGLLGDSSFQVVEVS